MGDLRNLDDSPDALTISDSGKLAVTGAIDVGDIPYDQNLGITGDQNGVMAISSGGTVTSGSGVLGNVAGTTGTVSVDGQGSGWMTTGSLNIGGSGAGNLTITNGGSVAAGTGDAPGTSTTDALTIGIFTGSTGTVTVDGTGSSLSSVEQLTVGAGGTGTLTVSNSGSVTAPSGIVVGSGFGTPGTGTLMIESGGGVSTPLFVAGTGGGTGTVTVDGANSVLNITAGSLDIADSAQASGGTLTVQNGATVTVQGDGIFGIGAGLDVGVEQGNTGMLTLTGVGTTLNAPVAMTIGDAGKGIMTVNAQAKVLAGGAVELGAQSAGSGTVTVDDARFTVASGTDEVTIGDAGTGMMTVQNSGFVGAAGNDAIVAEVAGSNGTLTVTDPGSSFTSNTLTVGGGGKGTAIIEKGGSLLTNTDAMIGADAGGTGSVTVVSNMNSESTWAVGGDLTVGGSGNGALTVQAIGAKSGLSVTGALVLGEAADSSGIATVNGPRAIAATGDVIVGDAGSGTLSFVNGAKLSGADLVVGNSDTGNGTVAFSDDGTTVQLASAIIGNLGTGMTTLSSEANVSVTGETSIGESIGGGTLTVSNAAFKTGGNLIIGDAGNGQLIANTAATVIASGALVDIGADASSQGLLLLDNASFTASMDDGTGSPTSSTDTVLIGDAGTGTVNIRDGGSFTATNADVYLGEAAGSDGELSVSGSGVFGAGFNSNNLTVGEAGTGALTAQTGGTVTTNGTATVGEVAGSSGLAEIDNASWVVGKELIVGDAGAGAVTVNSGDAEYGPGKLSVAGLVEIGAQSGATGRVAVDGAGSVLTAQSVYVGGATNGAGGTGALLALDSGAVQIATRLVVWGNGAVYVTGGTRVDSAAGGTVVVGAADTAVATGTVIATAGGTVSGTGAIYGSLVDKGGTIHVGDDPGILTVQGDYVQSPNGTLAIEVGPASTSLLDVTGSATIAGGTLSLLPVDGGMINLGQPYTVLTAVGGITGSFTNLIPSSPFISLLPSLSDGSLDLIPEHRPGSFAAVAITPNQTTVAAALDQAAATASGDFRTGINQLSNGSVSAVKASFDTLSGEAYGDLATIAIGQSRGFSSAMLDRLGDVADGAGDNVGIALTGDGSNVGFRPNAAPQQSGASGFAGRAYSVWAEGDGDFSNNTGGAYGSHSFNTGTSGIVAGIDARITPNWVAGAAFGYGYSDLNAPTLQSNATLDDYDFALYSGASFGWIYVRGDAGYVSGNASLTRGLDVAGIERGAEGSPDSRQMFGALETGEDFVLAPGLNAEPFARLDAARYWQDSVTKSDAGGFGLLVAGQEVNSLQTTLGSGLAKIFDAGSATPLTVSVQAGWAHEFAQTKRPVTAAFAGAPGFGFMVEGAPVNRNTAVVSTGVSMAAGKANVFIRYDGQYGSLQSSSMITGGLVFLW